MTPDAPTPLRTWLRRAPQPVAILADQQRVAVPTSNRKWIELESTIRSLGACRLVALDAQGATLRATTLDDDDDGAPAPAAAPSSALATDLAHMSRLLADAYRTGAETSYRAMSGAIEENTKLVRLLADRLGAIEVAWQRSLTTHARLVTDLAEARGSSSGDDQMLANLIPLMAAQHAPKGK